ncbi:MAG: glycosyltransferase [Nitrospirales bacterium]|nr:glycosyltransferase [Nitrospira sp.]MDR4501928.1 glycosyltransferase [Nitrospirales bacterium]
MPNKGNIIAFDINPWQGPWMNRQQLLSRLAQRGWNIVYSKGQCTLWDRNDAPFKTLPFWPSHDSANGVTLDVPGKVLASWPVIAPWRQLCDFLHAWKLKRLLLENNRQNGQHKQPLIGYIFHPSFYPYVQALKPDYLVFHVRDAYPEEPGWTSNDQMIFEKLADQSDLIIASGQAMASCLPSSHHERAVIIPNGADAETFINGTNASYPDDLAQIPHPRVCYAGRLTAKIDLPLLYELALTRPHYHFIIIGLIANYGLLASASSSNGLDVWLHAIQEIQKLPNVHYLGAKDPTELPAYITRTDVNIMIYATHSKNARWAKFCYPLKLHEYLATGLPVVSSPLAAIDPFQDVVASANSKEEWLDAIDDAINNGGRGTKEQRQATARLNNWENRTTLLEETIQTLIHKT